MTWSAGLVDSGKEQWAGVLGEKRGRQRRRRRDRRRPARWSRVVGDSASRTRARTCRHSNAQLFHARPLRARLVPSSSFRPETRVGPDFAEPKPIDQSSRARLPSPPPPSTHAGRARRRRRRRRRRGPRRRSTGVDVSEEERRQASPASAVGRARDAAATAAARAEARLVIAPADRVAPAQWTGRLAGAFNSASP